MSFQVDPGITDAECANFSLRLEDRYNQGDMAPSHPPRSVRVDPIGYTRWESSYLVKRQSGVLHEEATRAVLEEINAIVGPPQPTPIPPGPVGPFVPAPRDYRGNMCGVHVPNLDAPVNVGQADLSLVLSWFIDRYGVSDRQRIYHRYKQLGIVDVLVSWPDSQDNGSSPAQFRAFCQELIANDFRPCVMLSAKPTSSATIRDAHGTLANIMLVLPLLVGIVPRFCIGWELSLWLSPADLQFLIDQIAPMCLMQVGTQVFCHFQEGYISFPEPNHDNASFWVKQVGKLSGVLAERRQKESDAQMLDWINDCLERFAGNDNMPADSGFGHGFDFVVLEISAEGQFANTISEADGDRLGRLALSAPTRSGPAGIARVYGSGNGQ